jgi:hypothetical protein
MKGMKEWKKGVRDENTKENSPLNFNEPSLLII